MIDLIRLGDTADHGGEVVTASQTMRYAGRRVAREGDLVECLLHPEVQPNIIIEGDREDHGSRYSRRATRVIGAKCGCSLISSLV